MADSSIVMQLYNLPAVQISRLSYDISKDLAHSSFVVRPGEDRQTIGERGDPVTIGVILLAIVNNGAVASLIECISAYISQEQNLKILITSPDGTRVEIDSKNVNSSIVHGAIDDIIRLLRSKGK